MAPKKQSKSAASTEAPTETATSTGIKGRVFLPMQSAGRLGKSTFVDVFAGWLDDAGIPWRGADFDSAHATFSRAYENVVLTPLDDKAAIPRMLDFLSTAEPVAVSILDMPAQATAKLLENFRDYGALELFGQAGLRATVPLFLVDDMAARESLLAVVKSLQNSVDYVLIRNPARGTSYEVEATPLVSQLIEDGTPIITLPELSPVTLKAIQTLQKSERKYFPLSAVGPLLPGMPRLELSKFLPRVWRQMEAAAEVLLPDRHLIVNKVVGGHAPQSTTAHDPFDA